jgi:hypothetical protein
VTRFSKRDSKRDEAPEGEEAGSAVRRAREPRDKTRAVGAAHALPPARPSVPSTAKAVPTAHTVHSSSVHGTADVSARTAAPSRPEQSGAQRATRRALRSGFLGVPPHPPLPSSSAIPHAGPRLPPALARLLSCHGDSPAAHHAGHRSVHREQRDNTTAAAGDTAANAREDGWNEHSGNKQWKAASGN